jgi:SAM-dependent methyltransferase
MIAHGISPFEQVDDLETPAGHPQQDQAGEHRQSAEGRHQQGLLRRRPCRFPLVLEADQQIRAERRQLPEDVQRDQVPRQHRPQHRRQEHQQVGLEHPQLPMPVQIAARIHRDQDADPRDQQHEQQAQSVVGVDISKKMLERAKAYACSRIEYQHLAIEDIDFDEGEFDVVISSLALHYVQRFDTVCRKVHHCLVPGGTFTLSVEHPVFTAVASQDWHYGPQGEKLHWPVDDYQNEGPRQTKFLDHDVVKYHRTVAFYVNTLIHSGFMITKLSEPQPTQEMLDKDPDMQDETRRPIFLLLAAVKN